MSGEALVVRHKDDGLVLTKVEHEAADAHSATSVPGAAENSLLYVKADKTVAATSTPLMSKVGINSVTTPVKELEMPAGTAEFGATANLLLRGVAQGNFGRHRDDREEFLHALLNETTGTAIADKAAHWPGTFVGTIGNVTVGLPAGLASAVDFDATDYIDFSKISMVDWEEMSFAAWEKVPDGTTTWCPLAHNVRTAGAVESGWSMMQRRGIDQVYLYYGGQVIYATATDGVWAHVVGTIRRGKDMRLYVNGALAATLILNPATENWSLDSGLGTWLGSMGGGSFAYLIGQLADARLFSRAITPEEVAVIYAGGAGTLAPLRSLVAPGVKDGRWRPVSFTATPTQTYSVASADARLVVGAPIRWMQVAANGWRYGVVGTAAAGTVSFFGAPMSTGSALLALEVGRPEMVALENAVLPGTYSNGPTSGSYLAWKKLWARGPAALAGLALTQTSDDSGAEAVVNVEIAASAVSTASGGNGVTPSQSAWVPALATPGAANVLIDPATAEIFFGESIQLKINTLSGNLDAVDLFAEMVFVLK